MSKVQRLIAAANSAAASAPQSMSHEDAERYGPRAVSAKLGELEDWQEHLVQRTFMHAYVERERTRLRKNRAMQR